MDSKAFFQSSTLISTKNEKKLEVFLFVSNIHVFTKNMGSVIFMGGGGFVYNSAHCVLYKSIWIIEYSPIVRRFGLPCPLYSYLLYDPSSPIFTCIWLAFSFSCMQPVLHTVHPVLQISLHAHHMIHILLPFCPAIPVNS